MNLFSYWFSDKIVLRMYSAREVTEAEAPVLYSVTRDLAMKMNMPMPKVYVIPSDAPNAFATGRNPKHAAVAATEGILRLLTREELMGVMAHEMGHVIESRHPHRNDRGDDRGRHQHDCQHGAVGNDFWRLWRPRDDTKERADMIGAIAMIILAPIAAALIQMAISRSREYEADATGARICGNPMSLASALKKLQIGIPAHPAGCQSGDSPHVHRESAARRRNREACSARIRRWRSASRGWRIWLTDRSGRNTGDLTNS